LIWQPVNDENKEVHTTTTITKIIIKIITSRIFSAD